MPSSPNLDSTPVARQRSTTKAGVVALGLAATLGAFACDIPTSLPDWLTEWQFVGVDEEISTQELLPDRVRLEDEVFEVDSILSSRTVTLGEVCELCTCFSGPIPELDITPQDFALPLPSGLSTATLVGGSASLVLHNEMGFDLLNDGGGNQGFVEVELRNRVFGTVFDVIRLEQPFPPNDSLRLEFDLTGLELDPFLVASVRGTTPGSSCDSVSLDPSDGIRAEVALRGVEAAEVRIVLADQALRFPFKEIDLPDAVSERLRPEDARIILEIEFETSVSTEVEVLLSASGVFDDLFTADAALFTPIPVPAGTIENPTIIKKLFVLDLTSIENAENLFIATRNRVTGNRQIPIRGGETVRYRATVRAQVPTR